MNHDFDDETGEAKYSKDGKNCTGVGKIMDYEANNKGYLGEKWSKCSVEDFTRYFNSKGGSKGFCLMPGKGRQPCAPIWHEVKFIAFYNDRRFLQMCK